MKCTANIANIYNKNEMHFIFTHKIAEICNTLHFLQAA